MESRGRSSRLTQPPPSVEPVPQTALEQTIGLKWAGWIGAVVVVIGAGLGIKFAYEQGWFNILPPAGAAGADVAGGFWADRRRGGRLPPNPPLAAACLFGAGVATLFLVSYAGHGYYRLYEPETAFVLMGLTTIIGAAVAVRGNLLPIASPGADRRQPRAGAAPQRPAAPGPVPHLPAHAPGGRPGPVLVGRAGPVVGVAGHVAGDDVAVVLAALGARTSGSTSTLLTFSLLYAALYQAELLLSAAPPALAVADAAAAEPLSMSPRVRARRAVGRSFSVWVTALLDGRRPRDPPCGSRCHARGVGLALPAVCAALGSALVAQLRVRPPALQPRGRRTASRRRLCSSLRCRWAVGCVDPVWLGGPGIGIRCRSGERLESRHVRAGPARSYGAWRWHTWAGGRSVADCQNIGRSPKQPAPTPYGCTSWARTFAPTPYSTVDPRRSWVMSSPGSSP